MSSGLALSTCGAARAALQERPSIDWLSHVRKPVYLSRLRNRSDTWTSSKQEDMRPSAPRAKCHLCCLSQSVECSPNGLPRYAKPRKRGNLSGGHGEQKGSGLTPERAGAEHEHLHRQRDHGHQRRDEDRDQAVAMKPAPETRARGPLALASRYFARPCARARRESGFPRAHLPLRARRSDRRTAAASRPGTAAGSPGLRGSAGRRHRSSRDQKGPQRTPRLQRFQKLVHSATLLQHNSASSQTGIPSSLALSSFDPASSPATTRSSSCSPIRSLCRPPPRSSPSLLRASARAACR